MKIYVKYMVCFRCKLMVIEALKKIGITYSMVELGTIEVQDNITRKQMAALKTSMHGLELEILEDKRSVIIERIKSLIIQSIHYSDEGRKQNYSALISEALGYDYTYLSNVFSEAEGITVQQFIILHKIERIKELIQYGELTLTEIAYRLDYSSVAHLSNQFKKQTGFSPSGHKQLKFKTRKCLVEV